MSAGDWAKAALAADLCGADWLPRSGRRFVPSSLLAIGLVYAGVWVLFGSGQTFRAGGALALASGVWLTAVIVGYVRRPAESTSSPLGTRFPPAMGGYRADDVDTFFETIEQQSLSRLQTPPSAAPASASTSRPSTVPSRRSLEPAVRSVRSPAAEWSACAVGPLPPRAARTWRLD